MRYSGDHLSEIIFPLGGIGSDSCGLCGNGRLRDFEIFNRPDKEAIMDIRTLLFVLFPKMAL